MKPSQKFNPPVDFESAMNRLEKIVEEMENAELPLEEILQRYEEGVKLRQYCEEKLKEAEKRIQKISPGPDNLPTTSDFEVTETDNEEKKQKNQIETDDFLL